MYCISFLIVSIWPLTPCNYESNSNYVACAIYWDFWNLNSKSNKFHAKTFFSIFLPLFGLFERLLWHFSTTQFFVCSLFSIFHRIDSTLFIHYAAKVGGSGMLFKPMAIQKKRSFFTLELGTEPNFDSNLWIRRKMTPSICFSGVEKFVIRVVEKSSIFFFAFPLSSVYRAWHAN